MYVYTYPRNGEPFYIGEGQAGTLPYKTRDAEGFKKSGRWEFEGVIATEVRDEYIGNSVGLGEQNPLQKHMKSANTGLYRTPTSSADKL